MDTSANGWYLLSTKYDMSWSSARTLWGLNNKTVDPNIYELKQYITHQASLTQDDWTVIDTTTVPEPQISYGKAYWVQVTDINTNPNLPDVIDTEHVLTLKGDSTETIELGSISSYEDAGVNFLIHNDVSYNVVTSNINLSELGEYNYTYKVSYEVTRTVKVEDTNPPPKPAIDLISSPIRNTVAITGTGVNGDTITLYEGSNSIGTANVSNGTWSIIPSTLNAGQTYTIKARATDPAGNLSVFSDSQTIEINPLTPITTDNIQEAVNAWIQNSSTAEDTYGDISTWNTINVTDMSNLFKDKTSFNDDISGWNVSNVVNMESMFNRADAFNQPIGSWNVSSVENMNMMFHSYRNGFNPSIGNFNQDIGSWDVSKVKTMKLMFKQSVFNQDIGNWNVSSVEDMEALFDKGVFNQNIDRKLNVNMNGSTYTAWDVSNVTSMKQMFLDNQHFKQDINNWNVSNVTNMYHMFRNAHFHHDISGWNVSNVTNMEGMFYYNTMFNIDIGSWIVDNVTRMKQMFYNATAFNQNIGSWNVDNVTNMNEMFYNATAFNQNIGSWNVEKVTHMYQMFNSANAFNQNIRSWNVSRTTNLTYMLSNSGHIDKDVVLTWDGYFNWVATPITTDNIQEAVNAWIQNSSTAEDTYGDISTWNTINVTDMSNLFKDKTSFNDDISGWNVSNVVNMESMFNRADAFNQPIGSWNVSSVENMNMMFHSYRNGFNPSIGNFNQDIGSWDVSKVKTMKMMFKRSAFNQDIGNWNVSSVEDMEALFDKGVFNQNIDTKPNVTMNGSTYTAWDVSNVTSMKQMFLDNQHFKQDINNWNVSNVTNMYHMFRNAHFHHDISGWNVSNVTNMEGMFYYNTMFNIDIGSWIVDNVTNMKQMFYNATAFNQNIGSWNVEKVTNMNQMFNSANAFNQNIRSWNVSSTTNLTDMLSNSGHPDKDLELTWNSYFNQDGNDNNVKFRYLKWDSEYNDYQLQEAQVWVNGINVVQNSGVHVEGSDLPNSNYVGTKLYNNKLNFRGSDIVYRTSAINS